MGTFEEEWAQAKQGAAHNSRTRLASAEKDGGRNPGGAGDVRSDKAAWNAAGHAVGQFRRNIRSSSLNLEQGKLSTHGLESAAAEQSLSSSWKRYLDRINARCGELESMLEKAGNDHYKNDQAIQHALARMTDKYKETPGADGKD
ncbi:hypothetical protein AAHZ94_32595 [Streptomyces sp. HSW2009]|uniref:hypothetical protein n=1 Tax=Streptomyces sp. HSW2009 TaxID=3142890 RepID=UPI0032EB26D1